MAAAPGLLFALLLLGQPWRAPGQPQPDASRRFSEHKLCADAECSMLMYRGEALEDFTGPDCRFVNFKRGDPIYVYYKLAGRSPEVWAGTVGRTFGYFPKDLIQVDHEYTKVELQVPADETDFVCFEGGEDDFDNYNIEELLGFLELHSSAGGDAEKAVEDPSQHVAGRPDVSEGRGPGPDPAKASSEDSAFSESPEGLQERSGAQNRAHPRSQADRPQGERASEPLQDEPKVPDRENKTSSSPPVSSEQEKTDAYKLLQKEMTLDLTTRLGSTADVLVSDDEATRLVTSLEDDFDEEPNAEYYVVGKEEEDGGGDDLAELPLLTFTDGAGVEAPPKSGVDVHSTDREQNASDEEQVGVTQPPGTRNDAAHVLTPPEGAVLSAVPEGGAHTGLDSEGSNSEEDKAGDDAFTPDSKWGEPPSPTAHTDPGKAEEGLSMAEVPKTNNDKDPDVDADLGVKGKGGAVEEPQRDLGQEETGLEDERRDGRTPLAPAHSGHLASEKGGATSRPAFASKENGPKGAAVLIAKGTRPEEGAGEQIWGGGSGRGLEHTSARNPPKEGKAAREAAGAAPLPGGKPQNASADSAEAEADVAGRGPEPHTPSVGQQGQESKPEQLLETQTQLRFSPPDQTASSRELHEDGPVPGRNLSWQQEKDVAAESKQGTEKTGPSEGAVTADAFREASAHPQPGTREAETAGRTAGTPVPDVHPGKPEAEDDDYTPEELLEDENAVSAKQSKEKGPEMPDRQLDVKPQVPKRGIVGAFSTRAETEENEAAAGNALETERKSRTVGEGVDPRGGEPRDRVTEKDGSPPVTKNAQRPSEGMFLPDEKNQTPELGDAFQGKDFDDLEGDSAEEPLQTSRLADVRGPQELSPEGQEAWFTDTDSWGAASEGPEDGLLHRTPRTTAKPGLRDPREDLPIISSFFQEQQSLQRFQKYLDVHELEAMFQEMSVRLKSAQRDSLPYNVEKVLDKVFRASESQILSVAEKMLDARKTEHRALGMKEENVLEETAVLEDVQDLIYFVRYQQSTGEETAPLATVRPLEGGWSGPAEEIQPPLEGDLPQENTDLKMQIPEEFDVLDQLVTSDMDVPEVSQEPNTEKDRDLGIITTESPPVNTVDGQKQLETNAEDLGGLTPLENAEFLIHSLVSYVTKTLVAALPADVQPGPDFYGLPWKPVLITVFLGIASFAIFMWRNILVVKERVYQVSEQQISEKLKTFMKENAELVQKLSDYEQKIKESKKHVQETKKQNLILSDEAVKLKDKIKKLEETNESLNDRAKSLRVMLESERGQNAKHQDLILENKKSLEKLKDVIAMNSSELAEVQIALNEAKLNEEKVKSECHRVQEENARLTKKKEQLQQEIKDWSKSHAELSEQIRSFEKSQTDLEVVLTQKDDHINALTNCITLVNRLDCESEPVDQSKRGNESDKSANEPVGGDRSEKMKNQIKQMMDISRTQTAVSVVEEDLKLLQVKLRASMSTKCNLEDQIKKLEDDRNSLQSAKAGLEDECKTLRQKVEILNELYQQKEMALQKKLSQESYERQEREQRLSAADEKVVSVAEEVKAYKRRIEEMEEELQKTERASKNQIVALEKKAHDSWLKARAAERAIAEEKREYANLRHKLFELTEKIAVLQGKPVIVKPMPGRPNAQNPPRRGPLSQNGSFGPSPVSGGELSPPLTADSPPRPLSAALNQRDVPRSEFGSVDGPLPRPAWPSEAAGRPSVPDAGPGAAPMTNSSSRSSSPSKVMDEGKQSVPQEPEGPSVPSISSLAAHPEAVNMAAKGPPPFPGVPLMSSPGGGPPQPPIRYGPPPQLFGPFGPLGPRPFPPPFGPGVRLPLGLREYPPGVPPGRRDLAPREFLPGHAHFRPLGPPGPREYFIPGARLPAPAHGPHDYPPPPAAGDSLPPGSGAEPPPASQSGSQASAPALKQSP